jgi:hypothetical protein
MQISKKIYTTLIIALLTLSTMAAVIPMALAINPPVLTPNTGAVGTKVEVAVTGSTDFGKVEVFWDTLATKIGEGYADGTGAVDIDVFIPDAVVGAHDIIVQDVLASTIDSNTFTVTEKLVISTETGLPGDSLTATGTGFGDELPVGIYLGAITPVAGESLALAGTPVTGTLAQMPVVIGTVDLDVDVTITGDVGTNPIAAGAGTVTGITDDGEGNLAGTADIAVDDGVVTFSGVVTVSITGSINYATGVITLSVTGVDEGSGDAVTNIDVTMDTPATVGYSWAEYDVTPIAGEATNDEGFFESTIVIPAIAVVDYGPYAVTAFDLDGNTAAAANPLVVDYYVTVDPVQGPAGITITISGRIPASTDYELRLDTTTIATGTSGADTTFSATQVISSFLSQAPHDITVVWAVTETRTTQFTVTAPPEISYSPMAAAAGTVITISSVAGSPFSAGANITLYLGATEVNSTAMDDRFGPTVAFGPAAGSFTGLEFTVPTLTPGAYVIKVTDEFGASTGNAFSFTVLPTPVTNVGLNGNAYYPGDSLSFSFVSTDTITANPTVTIKDPSGATWWTVTWVPTPAGTSWVIPYSIQLVGGVPMALPADAPLGSWNWTITYSTLTAGPTSATGLFTVSALPTMQTVLDRLDTMEATLTDVITTTENDIIAVVNTKTGTIMTDISSLDAKLTSIDGGMATISTSIGEIQTTLAGLSMDALGASIDNIQSGVATIQTNLGTVSTAVSNLDAKLTNVQGDVATVLTNLGTLDGKVTSIDGKVATVETDVGTIQVDVSDVKGSVDQTPVWIAVVLSLVAAIAAIFAVITIRQKIAG